MAHVIPHARVDVDEPGQADRLGSLLKSHSMSVAGITTIPYAVDALDNDAELAIPVRPEQRP